VEIPCCKQKFHVPCLVAQINAGYSGKLIKFNHLKCGACRSSFDQHYYSLHPEVQKAVSKHKELKEKIDYLRAEADRKAADDDKGGWAFFKCSACDKPFCGGKVSCAEEENLDEKELVCPECDWAQGSEDHRCFKHGQEYAIFKCDSCCAPASWSCTSNHYCERCHNQAGRRKFYPCPGLGKCALGMPHPPNVEASHMQKRTIGFVIGCEKCDDPLGAVAYKYDSTLNAFEDHGDDVFSLFKYKKKAECIVVPNQKPEVPVGPAIIPPVPQDVPIRDNDGEDDDSSSDVAPDGFFEIDSDSDESENEDDEFRGRVEVDLRGFHIFLDSDSDEDSDESDFSVDLRGFNIFRDSDDFDISEDLQGFDLFYNSDDSDTDSEISEDLDSNDSDTVSEISVDLRGFALFDSGDSEALNDDSDLDLHDFKNIDILEEQNMDDSKEIKELLAPPFVLIPKPMVKMAS